MTAHECVVSADQLLSEALSMQCFKERHSDEFIQSALDALRSAEMLVRELVSENAKNFGAHSP